MPDSTIYAPILSVASLPVPGCRPTLSVISCWSSDRDDSGEREMSKYEPRPEDTSSVVLTSRGKEVVLELSVNAHEVWAHRKRNDGWQYGEKTNRDSKLHEDLKPYAELPDSQKRYDQDMTQATIKYLIKKNYRLEDLGYIEEEDSSSDLADAGYRKHLELWQAGDLKLTPATVHLHLRLGEWLIKKGDNLTAFDVLSGALQVDTPPDVEKKLRQKKALALMRMGDPGKAEEILLDFKKENDQETLGLLASCEKIRWEQASTPEEKSRALEKAFEAYNLAYAETGGYWTGINAATLALIKGDNSTALSLASRVQNQCQEEEPRAKKGDMYWLHATIGEAQLIQRSWEEARSSYEKALRHAPDEYGEIAKTRRNAQLILETHGVEEEHPDMVPIPDVVVFAGHMIDRPDRLTTRFPPELVSQVKESIKSELEKRNCRIGYAGAACGSDLLFHDVIQDLGGESYVVLPYKEEQFVPDCVDYLEGDFWKKKFQDVIKRATDVYVISPHGPLSGGVSFAYANNVLDGLARLKAAQFGKPLERLVVWDGRPGDGPGGTHDIVRGWQEEDLPVTVIDINRFLTDNPTPLVATMPPPSEPIRIMSMVFADAKGFSKLTESQVTTFVEKYMGRIASLIESTSHRPVFANTWGDGMFLVFDTVRDAGLFALELSEHMSTYDPTTDKLPETMKVRIGLHSGPVTPHFDPIMGRDGYHGTHISRAARIEPITPPGEVYTSQQFAALTARYGIEEFACDYVGRTRQAKKYGTMPTYHLRVI